jgi:hypothetical protein
MRMTEEFRQKRRAQMQDPYARIPVKFLRQEFLEKNVSNPEVRCYCDSQYE